MTTPFDPNYGLGPEPPRDDRTDAEVLADRIAERLDFAVVQRVPRALIAMLREGSYSMHQLLCTTGRDQVTIRLERIGNELEVTFWANGSTVATFRFQGRSL
jgi:hypothetical protein